jgi:2-polyprenyl-3-methyl-5-hydroxy-6-metoxy-1,4-benzoquinol methylase
VSADHSFLRCRVCGSLYDSHPPTATEAKRLYEGSEYFVRDAAEDPDDDTLWGYPENYLEQRPFIDAKFDRVLQHIERYVRPGRLLDIGAGPGFLVAVAERRGWSAVGLDLNKWAAEYARDELGVDVRAGDLADDPFPDEQFDAITMMDVVEHVPDPDELLARVAGLVRPGGTLALLTPDAASPISRLFGRRWPEVRRPGEHVVLFSVPGLTKALARHGFVASGWHSIGKRAPVAAFMADVAPVAPAWTARLREAVAERPIGKRVVELDPRTKFCLYARRLPDANRPPGHLPARIPRRPDRLANVDQAIVDELEDLGKARRLCAWIFDAFAEHVDGSRVLEVGAGIGTFTERMLDAGARDIVAMEPEDVCADVLERKFSTERRVRITRDSLPHAPSLAEESGTFDLVVCLNVLEHIGDDQAAVSAMAGFLRPGGWLCLLVPNGPKLFGALDDAYGHWRRYTSNDLLALLTTTGLEVQSLRWQNALGMAGWWAKKSRPGARIGSTSLRMYELLVSAFRPLEQRLQAPIGLSLVCLARQRGEPGPVPD